MNAKGAEPVSGSGLEVQARREAVGLDQASFARTLCVDAGVVAMIEASAEPVPEWVEHQLSRLEAVSTHVSSSEFLTLSEHRAYELFPRIWTYSSDERFWAAWPMFNGVPAAVHRASAAYAAYELRGDADIRLFDIDSRTDTIEVAAWRGMLGMDRRSAVVALGFEPDAVEGLELFESGTRSPAERVRARLFEVGQLQRRYVAEMTDDPDRRVLPTYSCDGDFWDAVPMAEGVPACVHRTAAAWASRHFRLKGRNVPIVDAQTLTA